MNKEFIADKTFENKNYKEIKLPLATYENCIFNTCNFENGMLADQQFLECRFIECNLSNANLKNTIFKETLFSKSKLLGLSFFDCDTFLFSVNFSDCVLNFSSFYQLKLRKTLFKNCILEAVDFAAADACEASFNGSDLNRAIFKNTNLEKADFSTATNYKINPGENHLKHAKFSMFGLSGLLQEYQIQIVT